MKATQNNYFDRFDKLFDDIYENISDGWRSSPADNFHVAVIVYQRILLECMDSEANIDGNGDTEGDDNLSSVEKLKQIKLWVTGYV